MVLFTKYDVHSFYSLIYKVYLNNQWKKKKKKM